MLTDSLKDQAHDERLEIQMNTPVGSKVDAPCDNCDGEGCNECRGTGFRKADVVECIECGGTGDEPGRWRGVQGCTWCKSTGKQLDYPANILWEIEVDCRHSRGTRRVVCFEWDLDYEISRLDRRACVITKLQSEHGRP